MLEGRSVSNLFSVLIPLTFLFGGILVIITAFRGRTGGQQEHPMKAKLSEEEFRRFRRREILIGCISGLGMSAFGGWLLWHWLYGATVR